MGHWGLLWGFLWSFGTFYRVWGPSMGFGGLSMGHWGFLWGIGTSLWGLGVSQWDTGISVGPEVSL